MSPRTNRRLVLNSRPEGRISDSDFELVEEPLPELREGEALIRVEWLSIDPTIRTWLDPTPTYLPPVEIGDVVRSLGLGRVVESRRPELEPGSLVQGLTGWQEWMVAGSDDELTPVFEVEGVASESHYLGALGMTGLTAWVGLTDIGKPQSKETVLVSAAAGAVGSVAGQIARSWGARVIGVAGGPRKCALLTERLGFDAAVDYKADDWRKQLKAAAPDGIDVNFENVGGEIMDAAFARLNLHARVVLCGMISGYNEDRPPPGPRNFIVLGSRRALAQGFIVLDHMHRQPEASTEIAGLMADGRLEALETVVEGLERAPKALNMLFDGSNVGKLVVRTGSAQ